MGISVRGDPRVKKDIRVCIIILLTFLILYWLTVLNIRTFKSQSHRKQLLALGESNDTLIDLGGFGYLQRSENICRSSNTSISKDNFLLILIHSGPDYFKPRQIVRETWGSVKAVGDWDIRYAFLLGVASVESGTVQNFYESPEETQEKIYDEAAKHGDIIIGNFEDSYRNLSYKQVMGYKWALRYCPQATYVVKVDNDVFINTFELTTTINQIKDKMTLSTTTNQTTETHVIVCQKAWSTTVLRDDFSKWFVSEEEYALEKYPDYCMGMGIILNFGLVKHLVWASEEAPFFWIDDVYVSGILREYIVNHTRVNVTMKDISNKHIFSDQGDFQKALYTSKEWKKERRVPWIFIHCSEHDIQANFEILWDYVLDWSKRHRTYTPKLK